MEKETNINLSTNEIQMIRTLCQDVLVSEPKNTELISSILHKITIVGSEPVKKKRGRPPKKIHEEKREEELTTHESKPKTKKHILPLTNFFFRLLKKNKG